jgi:hypothetical protein
MWIWKGTVKMRKMKRRRRKRWMRMRRRMRMRIMPKNLGRLARERWYIHQVTMLIPWYTINQPCYLSEARRRRSIPHGHNLRCLPHGQQPRSLAHDHELRRLTPSVGWSFCGL